MSELLQQAVYTPHNHEYHCSSSQHDYVAFDTPNGERHFLDGGKAYCRRSFHGTPAQLKKIGIVNWCLTSRNSWATICNKLLWGTRGPKGDQPLKTLPIASFELAHLLAILANCRDISPLHKAVISHWVEVKTQKAFDKGH